MLNSKITTREAIMIVVSVITSHIILKLPTEIFETVPYGTLTNIVYVSIIAIILAYLIYKLFKQFPGLDILDISEFLGGKILKNILGFIFINYFLISSGVFLRNLCESLEVLYYPMTNSIFIILFFIIAISITNKLEFNATFKTNLIIVPIVLLSIVFIFFSNMNDFKLEKIYPLLGNGFVDTFVTGLGNITSFSGIVFLYFMPPLLKEPNKFKKVVLSSVSISAIYLLFSIATLLFVFSFSLKKGEIMPLFSAARQIEFGTFFQRLESIFLLIWIISFACYLSIVTNFSLLTFKKIANLKDSKPLVYPVSLFLLGVSLYPNDYSALRNYNTNIFPYLVIGIVFVLCISILIFANIKKRADKKIGGELQ